MRTVTFGVANSLDNFIARHDHGVDWLLWSDDVQAAMSEFWETIDTVVMGRKTYDMSRSSGAPSYPGVTNYVCSRSLKPEEVEDAKVVAEDAAELVRALKAREGKGICVMGGGELARSLLAAGVIDELALNIHPKLLGRGVPLFHELPAEVDLELLECRAIEHGCVLLRYRVLPLADEGGAGRAEG